MNYEERYNQALERARIEYKNEQSKGNIWVCENLSTIFPELKESEDENIRKEIIDFIQEREIVCSNGDSFLPYKKWIAWLEKQGNKNIITPQWMIDFLKEHRRHFATSMGYDEKKETDGKLLAVIKWLEGNPQLEQKPTKWSEEDEKMFDKLYEILYRYGYSSHPEIELSSNEAVNLISWLKSLKSNHWKPTENQISKLLAVIHDGNNANSESCHNVLQSLYNDLKKL